MSFGWLPQCWRSPPNAFRREGAKVTLTDPILLKLTDIKSADGHLTDPVIIAALEEIYAAQRSANIAILAAWVLGLPSTGNNNRSEPSKRWPTEFSKSPHGALVVLQSLN